MSYSLPTLQNLLDRTRSAFRSSLPGSDAWIWPNNITVSAKVMAGAVFEAFGFAAYISKMIFASTAPDLETLILHGNEFGLSLRPAAPAAGYVRITSDGDCSVGGGAVFQRTDGVQYFATASASIVGAGTIDVPAIAATDGANTNSQDGTPLNILSGVTGTATAAAQGNIVGGVDIEDKETYRQRILFRKRNPPHGGAPSDYVLWSETVSGVTRVFVERRWVGSGTVRVFILMDDLYNNGIAPPADIARVSSYLETVSPSGAIVTVQSPTPLSIDVTISNLSPDTVVIREAVLAELRNMFQRRSRPGGNDTPHGGMPFLATPTTFSLSWIDQAISNAPGEDSHDLTVPTADTAVPSGQIAVLGNVTFA